MKRTMFGRLLLTVVSLLAVACSSDEAGEVNAQPTVNTGKTLVVYYSYTGNCRSIVNTLTSQIEADVVEIQPAEKGLKYEANNYALGTQLLNAIKNDPNSANSYPAIDAVNVSPDSYQNIIIVTPLWWSQMAAIMQTYLFNNAKKMAGKRIGLIVSSASSRISGVVDDCKRLVPDATWMGDALWINNGNRSRTASLVSEWLQTQNFQTTSNLSKMYITIDGKTQSVTLADTQAAKELAEKLKNGPVTVTLNASGGFEIWGSLGFSLTTSNQQITAQPGDVILYNGSNICIFYGSNDWSYTRLGTIDGLSENELREFLKAGESNISVTLSLTSNTSGIRQVRSNDADDVYYTLTGQRVGKGSGLRSQHPLPGILIKEGKKVLQ